MRERALEQCGIAEACSGGASRPSRRERSTSYLYLSCRRRPSARCPPRTACGSRTGFEPDSRSCSGVILTLSLGRLMPSTEKRLSSSRWMLAGVTSLPFELLRDVVEDASRGACSEVHRHELDAPRDRRRRTSTARITKTENGDAALPRMRSGDSFDALADATPLRSSFAGPAPVHPDPRLRCPRGCSSGMNSTPSKRLSRLLSRLSPITK